MAKQTKASGTPATAALTGASVTFTVHPYTHVDGQRHFGDEATGALGLDPQRVFKTLVVELAGRGGALAVGVVPVATQLDLKAFATALGAKKAAMARPRGGTAVQRLRPGRDLPARAADAARHRGRQLRARLPDGVRLGRTAGLQVELDPADLVAVTGATVAPISH